MTAKNLEKRLETLQRAYKRLKEVLSLNMEETDIVVDATIQRFEFTFELAWKTIKKFAETLRAGECNSGRSCIKLAYKLGWIKDEKKWLSLLEARNLTSHTYDQEIALETYLIIKSEHTAFENLILSLKKELENLVSEES
jgi:nucleotidyltransferase substrate binding protein (TIGR01987 family)